jgi:uncharacterized protein
VQTVIKHKFCDLHVHHVGVEPLKNGSFIRFDLLPKKLKKTLAKSYNLEQNQFGKSKIDEFITHFLVEQVDQSRINHVVLLAMDEVYNISGKPILEKTICLVDNDYVASIAENHKKILFGASIHPYRNDAILELERQVRHGACLMKWLPSSQGIDLMHKKCIPFYDALVEYKIPLLCHIGVEHVLAGGNNKLNNPFLLRAALDRGVTVIAAHCGGRIFISDKNYFKHWEQLVYQYQNIYGDISAFGFPLRRLALEKILNNPILSERILYGSDFPSPMWLPSFLGLIPTKKILQLNKISNPFDKCVQVMQAAGVPQSVFNRAYNLLRLSSHNSIG